jgi:enoyl-[acyl-carrier-protein] reductase (NADH)
LAVILGATSGSGLEIARAVAASPGLSIFDAHRGHWPDHAAELQRDVMQHGHRCVLHVGDAGTWDGTLHAADALAQVAAPQSVALFVHSIANASLGIFLSGGEGTLRPFNAHNFHKTMDSMANSFAWWARALVERDLLAPGARLLGLTNPIADAMIRNFGLITAYKAALEVYVKHLAWELGPRGCRANLLNLGTVDTSAVRRAFTPEKWQRFSEVVARAIPAGR